MTKQKHTSDSMRSFPVIDVEGFDVLFELALDMRWSWNHAADDIWRELDPELWDETRNPWILLQTISRDQIKNALSNPRFSKKIDFLLDKKRRALTHEAWFAQTYAASPLTGIAYFCMEFMLSQALPIYSGGLGNVAGDQLKTAADLGVPVIALGLLYQHGYFHQVINNDGAQIAYYPCNDFGQLPITPVRRANGEWIRVQLNLPGFPIWIRVWQVHIGSLRLYLLDTNDPSNYPQSREITSELYGGDPEVRLQQELVLGIGGCQVLAELGLTPEVFHLNEGHAAFAALERARIFMHKNAASFEVALAATRAGNLFTTHTAVSAGFDRFNPDLIEKYLSKYATQNLGISIKELLAFGRQNPDDPAEPFNMAYMAIHGCGASNGVSKLHGVVSRHLFAPLFPRWPINEVPIGYVTNGVHVPSWDSAAADDLWTEICGNYCWATIREQLKKDQKRFTDARLWELRNISSNTLVQYVRDRLTRLLIAAGESVEDIVNARHVLNPNALTLGFARRFATYKRPDLLLYDPERLIRLLTHPERPVQLVIAGKAHPADILGQELIKRWVLFTRRPEVRDHVIFLSDHDMLLTEQFVQGSDVWLNTPQRPWEACGTSGMKVLVNGGINLSELDGWWAEAYTPEVGWALGDGKEHGNDPAWNLAEAEALYDVLEQQVIPEFYARNVDGIPEAWVARMRASMTQLTPEFSTRRVLEDYIEQYYLPAATNYRARTADKGALAKQQLAWVESITKNWGSLRFGEVVISKKADKYLFTAQVYFGALDPKSARVELYANGINDAVATSCEMTISSDGLYTATVPADRDAADYTLRIIPQYQGVAVPLEVTNILWQR